MPRYESFVLRVWSSDRHERLQWTARLESLRDGGRLQFDSVEALLTHLRAALDPNPRGGAAPSPAPPQEL